MQNRMREPGTYLTRKRRKPFVCHSSNIGTKLYRQEFKTTGSAELAIRSSVKAIVTGG